MRKLTVNPLFLITKISDSTRIFIAISVISCYGLFLYEILPEYLFNPTFSLYYFGLPLAAIIGILVVIPKVMAKHIVNPSLQNSDQAGVSSEQLTDIISPDGIGQENGIISSNNLGIISDTTLPFGSQSSDTITNPGTVQQPMIDESVLNDMVARAIEPIQRESKKMQEMVNDMKNEITFIKSNIESLTETFESSLTDLKAFQTEIANPLNFMHKIFDSVDIKSLLDPTLASHAGQSSAHPEFNPNSEISQSRKESDRQEESNYSHIPNENSTMPQITKHDYAEMPKYGFSEPLPFKQMFNGTFTLGKLMTTISVLEEILQALDKDSIDILIEQCKSMGLRQEDEQVIYNIINMMDKSGLSVKEILIMLYKFGKVLGIGDNEADLVYSKLTMNAGKSQSMVTVESKGN